MVTTALSRRGARTLEVAIYSCCLHRQVTSPRIESAHLTTVGLIWYTVASSALISFGLPDVFVQGVGVILDSASGAAERHRACLVCYTFECRSCHSHPSGFAGTQWTRAHACVVSDREGGLSSLTDRPVTVGKSLSRMRNRPSNRSYAENATTIPPGEALGASNTSSRQRQNSSFRRC
jgi:hypothetical protein